MSWHGRSPRLYTIKETLQNTIMFVVLDSQPSEKFHLSADELVLLPVSFGDKNKEINCAVHV